MVHLQNPPTVVPDPRTPGTPHGAGCSHLIQHESSCTRGISSRFRNFWILWFPVNNITKFEPKLTTHWRERGNSTLVHSLKSVHIYRVARYFGVPKFWRLAVKRNRKLGTFMNRACAIERRSRYDVADGCVRCLNFVAEIPSHIPKNWRPKILAGQNIGLHGTIRHGN